MVDMNEFDYPDEFYDLAERKAKEVSNNIIEAGYDFFRGCDKEDIPMLIDDFWEAVIDNLKPNTTEEPPKELKKKAKERFFKFFKTSY